MLKNYLKIAVRSLFRNKIFSLINIIGLAIGLSASVMMFLIVEHEYSYDKHNEKIDRVGRAVIDMKKLDKRLNMTPPVLGPILKENFPEVELFARAHNIYYSVKVGEEINERFRFYSVDSSLTEVLSFEFIRGNIDNLYNNKEWVLLSESKSKKYFGDEDPIGKTLEIHFRKLTYLLTVSGVYKDLPETSTFQSSILVPFYIGKDEINNRFKHRDEIPAESWKSRILTTYVLINEKTFFNELNKKVEPFTEQQSKGQHQAAYSIQPLNQVYFNSANIVGLPFFDKGDEQKVFIYTIVAVLLLLISLINYVMLSSAKLADKIFEIGVRKVIGATRKSLMAQITLEAILVTAIALPISFVLIFYGVGEFSDILGIDISLDYINSFTTYICIVLISLSVSFLCGVIVSNRISKLNPSIILQNKIARNTKKLKLRHTFVLIQLVVFVSLIISSLVIKLQMEYLKNKNLGFNRENTLIVSLSSEQIKKYNNFKTELLNKTCIKDVSAATNLPPNEIFNLTDIIKNGSSSEKVPAYAFSVDYNFIDIMELEVIKGTNFIEEIHNVKSGVILNETAAREFGVDDRMLIEHHNTNVIGIVKDFNFQPLRDEIKPITMWLGKKYLDEVIIRLKSEDLSQTIADIEEVWSIVYPNSEMKYRFFDEIIDKLYTKEKNFSTVINTFTALALLITCLGLFGLIIFISEQRTKEIGIRKVLGASVQNILGLLSKEFVILVICASVIASPLAYYFINIWLENFAYRTEIGMEVFIYAGIMALLISLTTIGLNSIKAALANPVESLRNE